ncbi:unnamed protein product [Staurois parvus]|uniref:Uncharacterized protein n=1 Tax=Staurois parvus TaxID=386267 RepID=A0ABN9EWW2_9NEOB|nr:unnamed protein product [Staurois parvus]
MSLLMDGMTDPDPSGMDGMTDPDPSGMDRRLLGLSEVRLAGSVSCGQRGTGGASGEWSGSQARFSR